MKELTGKAGNHPGLSGYALKYLATAFMLCDHVAYFVIRRGLYAPWMSPEGGISFSDVPAYLLTANRVYWVLDILGRAAFPLFCFLLAEGAAHTRSRKAYLLTLLAFAAATEPVYDWTHYGTVWNGALQNVLFTLTISCGQLWVMEIVRAPLAPADGQTAVPAGATAAAAGALALLVRGEYVFLGTLSAALFYLLREKGAWRLLGLAPLLAASPWVALAAPLLLMYNGQRGRRGRKYFFYVFYPAHFLVLTALGRLCAKKF